MLIDKIRFALASRKKKHFMLQQWKTQAKIWDVEFRQFHLKKIREDIRREYDRLNEHQIQQKARLQNLKGDEKKTVEETIDRAKEDMEKLKQQMSSLDMEISSDHDTSCKSQLDALNQIRGMLKRHLKGL